MPTAPSDTESALPADALSAYVHDHADAYVDFLCRLARAESPSTDPEAQREVQRLMAEALADLDFSVTHLPGNETGGALYARPVNRTEERPCQLLLGHGDTVWDHGTLENMPVEVDGNQLRGPGVFDMKAGLANIVFALRALDALDVSPTVTPLVLATSDEEIGSPESRRHVERLARVAERVYVLEPALGLDGKIKTARKGTGEMTLRVRPTEASATGNVVLELSQLVQRLYELDDPERGVTINVGTIDGNQIDAETGTSYGQLAVDVRVPTHEAADTVPAAIQNLEAHASGVVVEVEGGIGRPPLERTPGNQRLWERARRLGQRLGLDLEEGRAGGGSDGNLTSQYTPTLDGLGAVGDGAHAPHEHIRIDETLDRCALLALLLMEPPRAEQGLP
jgi:glutamate carboxypeptidase